MKKIIWVALPVILLVLGYSFFSTDDPEAYIKSVENELASRRRYLEFHEQSPFVLYSQAYKDPEYFPIDPNYRVIARVVRIDTPKSTVLQTSDGKSQRYTHHAWLEFELKGVAQRLLILKPVGYGAAEALFCAFADNTSGDQTYGGGRYLDIKVGSAKTVTLDFNLAYNPYCAYVDEYSCPLPPIENILTVSIEAGEKTFSH